jgi:tetratricopeptide (TPR) repeat protein
MRIIRRALIVVGALICLIVAVWTGMHTDPAERNNAGNLLAAQAAYESALVAYGNAQVNAPDKPEAYYNAARVLALTGRYREASLTLLHALEAANPELAQYVYYTLGNVYFETAQYDQAVSAFRQALVIDHTDQNARYNYELALQKRLTTPTPQEQQTDPEENATDPQPTPTPNPADSAAPESPTPTPPMPSSTLQGTMSPSPTPTLPWTPTATPTNLPQLNPAGSATPQATFESPPMNPDTTSLPSEAEQALTIEQVEQRLDAIEQDQRTLREYLISRATPSQLNSKDW